MQHADKLIARVIFLDGMPNIHVLDPLHIGQTVKEVLDNDLQLEMAARVLYQEAATHCHSVKDYVSRDLFEKLMHDKRNISTCWRRSSTSSASLDLSCMHNTTSASLRTTDFSGVALASEANYRALGS